MTGQRRHPKTDADYFELLTDVVFQAGINWRVVEAKEEGMREAFKGFDPKKVAAMKPAQVEKLAEDPKIIRNRRKIEATIDNAHAMLEIERDFGDFKHYLKSQPNHEGAAADLMRRFRHVGPSTAYIFLWAAGEEVPHHEGWMEAHNRGRARKTA